MKGLVILLVAFCFTQIRAERDWSKITPVNVYPFGLNLKDFNITRPRIVGGNEAVRHSHPYQAVLFLTFGGKSGFCGGTVISSWFVVTAAHCLDDVDKAEVLLGAHNIHEDESTQQRITSTEFIIHEEWNPLSLTNDIGLIKLPIEIKFNDYVNELLLPCESDNNVSLVGKEATISGWGKDWDKATEFNPVLRDVMSEVFSEILCNISFLGLVTKKHVCTNGKGGKGACSGDSGGPVTILKPRYRTRTLIGIVSFGMPFGCEMGWPSVHTRVSSYVKWISQNTGIPICV